MVGVLIWPQCVIHAAIARNIGEQIIGKYTFKIVTHATSRVDLKRHVVLAINDSLQYTALKSTVEPQVDSCLDGHEL